MSKYISQSKALNLAVALLLLLAPLHGISSHEASSDGNVLIEDFDKLCTEMIHYGTQGYFPDGDIFNNYYPQYSKGNEKNFYVQPLAFLRIQKRDSKGMYYTRNFDFSVDEEGFLTVGENYRVYPEIEIGFGEWYFYQDGVKLHITNGNQSWPLVFYSPMDDEIVVYEHLYYVFGEVREISLYAGGIGVIEYPTGMDFVGLITSFGATRNELMLALPERQYKDQIMLFYSRLKEGNPKNFELFIKHLSLIEPLLGIE